MKKNSSGIVVSLSIMMFLQYLLLAVWLVPLAAYLTKMGISGNQKALILSSLAIGCCISPVIGMIADRFFASEKVLALINLFTAILLFLAAGTTNHVLLFWVLLFAMLLHMPTWGLTSSIAMTHSSLEKFPRIRVFGSIGWFASGIFSIVAVQLLKVDFDGSNLPFYVGAGVSLVAAIQNLTLPKTPPPAKGKKLSVKDALGLGSLALMKDKNYAMFIILSFLFMIPFGVYQSYFSVFLMDKGFKYITATMNWGQLVEIFVMLSIPYIISKFGLHKLLIIAIFALLIRYIAFFLEGTFDQSWLIYIGILLHGVIFAYYFVGGQIYIDKNTPAELRSQSQGFFFLITWGVGLLAGNFINGWIIERSKADAVTADWNQVWIITTVITLVVLLAFTFLFKVKEAPQKK
jgi:nucleoside transporter